MNKFIKIAAILAFVFIAIAALVYKFYVNKPHDDIEKVLPEHTLAATEIWKQYNTDLSLADSLYTGKVIELTGNFDRIDTSDTLVYTVFIMEVDSMFGDKSVRCEMLQKYNSEISSITIGSPIRIKGFCTGFDQTDIKFNKCSIVK